MASDTNFKLVEAVAALLAQKAATHPDFFSALVDALSKRGYTLEARQRGIGGTYLCLKEIAGKNEEGK